MAVEEDSVIGFAILEKPDTAAGNREGSVTIFEDGKHQEIGALSRRHEEL